MSSQKRIWIVRDYLKCSGCRKCEIACSLFHENKIWPEASRIRVFMLVPGVEVPHLCAQCDDYPCVESCPVNALSVSEETGAVLVDKEKCTTITQQDFMSRCHLGLMLEKRLLKLNLKNRKRNIMTLLAGMRTEYRNQKC